MGWQTLDLSRGIALQDMRSGSTGMMRVKQWQLRSSRRRPMMR